MKKDFLKNKREDLSGKWPLTKKGNLLLEKYFFIVTFFVILLPSIVLAADYYVATNGQDSNPGSEALPWRTIQKCANTINGGDSCVVMNGSYNEDIAISRSGSAGSLMSFVAQNSRQATLNGTISISGNYIKVEGFRAVLPAGRGTTVSISGSNNQILSFYFDDPAGVPGMNNTSLNISGSYVLASDNYIRGTCFGIILNGTYNTIQNNELTALKMNGDCGDVDYMRFFGRGHIIKNNRFHGINFAEIGAAHVDCFQTYDNNNTHIFDILVEGNWCSEAHQGFMMSADRYFLSDGLTVRNNVFKNCAAWIAAVHQIKNVRFYNNTFDTTGGIHGVGCRFEASCEFKNNIFYGTGSGYWFENSTIIDGTTAAPGKNNLLYKPGGTWTGYADDIKNVDPLFVNRTSNDYRIQEGSPARDAGRVISGWANPTDKNGVLRPQGSAWDIGAYEFRPGILTAPSNLRIVQ